MIQELDDIIRDRTPKREKIKLDLDALRRLKIEKLEVERNFTVIEVIRSIVAPGKGVRKELLHRGSLICRCYRIHYSTPEFA